MRIKHLNQIIVKGPWQGYAPRGNRITGAILETLVGMANKYAKSYVYPTHKTLLDRLERYHQVKISKRTLTYHLRRLELEGFIQRIRRIRRGKDGRLEGRSTLYKLGKGAKRWARWICKMARDSVKVWPEIWREYWTREKLRETVVDTDKDGRVRDPTPYLRLLGQIADMVTP